MKHALVALFSAILVVSCATPTREQSLVDRAVTAMGGTERLAAIKTIAFKGDAKYWEPEQSDVPGGDMRFANESTFSGITDVGARASRIDWVKNFAYPAPRTFTFSEIITPEAGYVIGVDSNGRNAQNLKASPPAHAMSGYRLATSQREAAAGRVGRADACHAARRGQGATGRRHQRSAGSFLRQLSSSPSIRTTGLPSRVRTLDYDNIWGDVNYDVVYSDWREVGGVQVRDEPQDPS